MIERRKSEQQENLNKVEQQKKNRATAKMSLIDILDGDLETIHSQDTKSQKDPDSMLVSKQSSLRITNMRSYNLDVIENGTSTSVNFREHKD